MLLKDPAPQTREQNGKIHALPLDQVLDELLHSYSNAGDWPTDHRCTKTGSHTCDHSATSLSLVERLEELIERGTGSARPDGGKQKATNLGSPAPWTAAPAELLLEIWHRAIDFSNELRDELGFGRLAVPFQVLPPAGVPFALVTVHIPAGRAGDEGGLAALLELPRLIDAAAGNVEAALVAGWIEQQIRGWHRRALLITGYQLAWTKLDQIPNPDHLANYDICGVDGGGYHVGPYCQACKHPSCAILRSGRSQRWIQPKCPYCTRSMLRRNPVTQAVHCLSPTCLDDQGKHHTWALSEWTRP